MDKRQSSVSILQYLLRFYHALIADKGLIKPSLPVVPYATQALPGLQNSIHNPVSSIPNGGDLTRYEGAKGKEGIIA